MHFLMFLLRVYFFDGLKTHLFMFCYEFTSQTKDVFGEVQFI